MAGLAHATALADAQQLTRDVAATWADFDVILTPTLAQPPARVGELRHDDDPERDFWHQAEFTPWTSTANLTGRPSISLPLHREVVEGRERMHVGEAACAAPAKRQPEGGNGLLRGGIGHDCDLGHGMGMPDRYGVFTTPWRDLWPKNGLSPPPPRLRRSGAAARAFPGRRRTVVA